MAAEAKMEEPHQAKLEDSNMAMYLSEEAMANRLAAAQTEDEYKGAGSKVGLEAWRIEQFRLKRWERHGEFYAGDSFIVLNTWKDKDAEGDKLNYDIHFWIGENSTQDEYGTAAYKAVELDTLLGDVPVQHREVQGHESSLFKSYFKPAIITMEGGVDSGFRHVEEEEYPAKLLWVKGKGKKVACRQAPLAATSLNSGDCFILDSDKTIFQWNGSGAGVFEKSKAATVVSHIKGKRADGCKSVVLDEGDEGDDIDAFFALLDGTAADVQSADAGGKDEEVATAGDRALFRSYSTDDGETKFEQVATGADVNADKLDNGDAFILDTGKELFAWIGAEASTTERAGAMARAVKYLQDFKRPMHTPVTRVMSGAETSAFSAAISAA